MKLKDVRYVMKKIISIFILLFACSFRIVKADTFYTNQYGVEFSKVEYNFISKFYFEGYQDYMTKTNYQEFIDSNIINGYVIVQEVYDYDFNGLVPYTTDLHETASKVLKLSSSCSNYCDITVILNWKKKPTTMSYDLIGSYFENTNMIQLLSANLYYENKSLPSIENTFRNNGISSTFKIPNTNELITIVQKYRFNKSGKIYVSYQHAKNNVTLAQSRKYSFTNSGYGGVFGFDSSVASKYDGMKGLSINLN